MGVRGVKSYDEYESEEEDGRKRNIVSLVLWYSKGEGRKTASGEEEEEISFVTWEREEEEEEGGK